MPAVDCTFVEVYLFRRRGRRVEFLALRRAPGRRLGGVWQPITGHLRRGETALAGAVRELREETGFTPHRWWALEMMTLFYDTRHDCVRLEPLFAAEVAPDDQVRLSHEHDAWRFLPARQAGALYLWESQRRGLDAVRREVLRGGKLARAIEVTALVARRQRGGTKRAGRRRPRPRLR